MTLVLIAAPLLLGWVRTLKARLLRRRGPSPLQPYRDLLRLIRKEVVLADNASWLFRAAPYIIFATIWVAAALVPTFATGLLFSWSADMIAIVALLGTARFSPGVGGHGYRHQLRRHRGQPGNDDRLGRRAGNDHGRLHALRCSRDPPSFSSVAAFMLDANVGLRVSLALVLLALLIVAIAENARIPVDNPATHLELTMVHEAMVLEYSGRHLAMIEAAAALKLVLYVSLISCVFLPWGMAAASDSLVAYLAGIVVYSAKLVGLGALLALFETAVAKMRVFRVPEFLGIGLMLGLLAMLLLFVSRGL